MRRRPVRLLGAATLLALTAATAALTLPAVGPRPVGSDPLDEEVCIVAPPIPYDPASGQAMLEPRAVPPEARCPVCGMYPARSPRWAAQLIFRDGAAQFFDSPVNLLIYLRNMNRYTGTYTAADVATSFVTDAARGDWVATDAAHFVYGSDARGPMRDGNLPAFATPEAAEAFAAARGGRVLAAAGVTDEMLRAFDRGRKGHRH